MKVTKAVIPAAGLGTRFLPITKAVPKPMLPVVDKPTIQYIVEELTAVGIDDIIIVISGGSDVIEKHFTKDLGLEERLLSDGKTKLLEIARKTSSYNIRFVVQPTANGLAGAILCAEPFVKNEPFALLLGDELLYSETVEKSCIKKLCDVYEKTGKTVLSGMEVFGDDVSKYGNIGFSEEKDGIMQVTQILEKPSVNEALSNYAVIGRYVISGEVMEIVKTLKPRGNEIYFTDALDILAKENRLVATGFDCERYDVGDKLGYITANVECALKSKEIGEETKKYILELAERLK